MKPGNAEGEAVDLAVDGRLLVHRKLLYGIGDISFALINSSVQFFLLIFFTDAVLLPPGLVSIALVIGKVWDAILDSFAGWLCDRTQSRFGRRRIYLLVGAIPLGLATMLLWYVPPGLSTMASFVWVCGVFMVWNTLWTFTTVPYYALTAELTTNYDERASLTAYRMILSVPAYIVGAACTPLIVNHFADKRLGYSMVGVLFGVVTMVSLLISTAGTKEPAPSESSQTPHPWWPSLRLAIGNEPFVKLVVAFGVANIGMALMKTLLAYFLTYQLLMKSQTPLVMATMLGFVVASIFPWRMVSARMDKGPAYAIGLTAGAIASAASVFLPHGPSPLIYLVAALAGLGLGANWVFPWAMIPDVVEVDKAAHGGDRCGIYYSLWGLTQKITEGLGIVLTGWLLEVVGYVPNGVQSESALWGIRICTGPLPALLMLAAVPMLLRYPITRQSHTDLQKTIRMKEGVHAR